MRLSALQILIVDDNAHMRALIGSVLRALGAEHVREAGAGLEAFALLEPHPADVVLLDYAMPDMDGFEFLRRLRATQTGKGPHVIMVTGYGDLRRVSMARDLGADGFLTKPLTAGALLERLEAVMQPRAPMTSAEELMQG